MCFRRRMYPVHEISRSWHPACVQLATVTELSFKNAGVLVKLFLLQFVVLAPTLFKSKIAAYEARKFPDAGADGSGVGSGEEEKKRK